MLNVKFDSFNNILVTDQGRAQTLNPKQGKKLTSLLEKYLPKTAISQIEFTFTGIQLRIKQDSTTSIVEDYKGVKEILETLQLLAPDASYLLAYDLHGIQNTSGHHCWVASALQLAYNLFPHRLDALLPSYNEITSSADFAQDFINLEGVRDGEPQEVFTKIIDSTIDPVTITLQELRLSHNQMLGYYDAGTIQNTILVSDRESSDFATLVKSSLEGPCDKETATYWVTEFQLKFPSHIPHLSFDLRNCAQSRSLDGTLTRKHILNIPLNLDENLLGASHSLQLQGAILHIGGTDDSPGNHYVAIFQKKHPITDELQWFMADDRVISLLTAEDVTKLLPSATYLYYAQQNTEALPSSISHAEELKDLSAAKKLLDLQNILKDLSLLRFQEQQPQSWLDYISDAFHGCDALAELDDAETLQVLQKIHQQLLPLNTFPSHPSTKELAFLQRKLIHIATQEHQKIKAEAERAQYLQTACELQASRSTQSSSHILDKIQRIFSLFF